MDAFLDEQQSCFNMRVYANRVNTFVNWPATKPSIASMAANGFYYTGRSDVVRCAFCIVEMGGWSLGDDVAERHGRWAPQCVSFKQSFGPPVYRNNAAYEQYAMETARLKTFDNWPKGLSQNAELMAEAGFFYTGSGDKVLCFYCKCGIKDWERDDDPWREHALLSPQCAYVTMVRSAEFIQKVVSSACVIKQASSLSSSEQTQRQSPKPSTSGKGSVVAAAARGIASLTIDENESSAVASSAVAGLADNDAAAAAKTDFALCVICFENERQIVHLPCSHMAVCSKCSFVIKKCCICRETFTRNLRVYFS